MAVITQCSMRHLYSSASEPGVPLLIDKAKLFERRRCDHHPEKYPEPLGTLECLSSVVDPKGSKTNKHRYVVASQRLDVRKAMRGILGVPLIHINRSVMIIEPMAEMTAENRERGEKSKFRVGLKNGRASSSQGIKRKREDENEHIQATDSHLVAVDTTLKKRPHGKGPKGPNPLSVKKPKKRLGTDAIDTILLRPRSETYSGNAMESSIGDSTLEASFKRKRRRKHKSNVEVKNIVDVGEDGPQSVREGTYETD
jgi:U3 small nucleolar RNA-associated protein 23